jgi:hypothetical protein
VKKKTGTFQYAYWAITASICQAEDCIHEEKEKRQAKAELRAAIAVLRALDREPIEIHAEQDADDRPMFSRDGAEERICRAAMKARKVAERGMR